AALAATLWPEAEAPPTTAAGPTTTTTTTIPVLDPWPGGFHAHRGDAGGTGLSDGGITGPEGLYWRATPSGEAQVGAVAAATRLFVGSSTRDEVTQIDQASGSISWQLTVSDRVLVPLSVGQLDVEGSPTYYVVWVANDGIVGAIDQTGAEVWRTVPANLPGVTRAAPVIDGGVVYLSRTADDGSGYVAALDLAGGSVLWRTDELGVEMGAVEASVSIGNGTVYVAPNGNRFHLLEVETGVERCSLIQGNGERPSRPVVADGFVALPADGGAIGIYDGSCSDMSTFNLRWETDAGTDVASADGVLYFVSEGGLLAIDPSLADPTGDPVNPPERVWTVLNPSIEGDGWVTSPVITGEVVLVGSEQGEVAAVDRATGEKVWSYDVGAEIVDDELTPVKGAIYVVTVDGEVLAIGGPRLDG
ncbi:MAG: PQQ-binding-like beta-propeller repeat protein, partial [Acidimicrobiia bacterium]